MTDLAQYRLVLELARALRDRGSWTGETHIQKVGYFLQRLFAVPIEADYILYKHGPYSFDVSATLAGMRARKYSDWRPNGYPYGPTLIEGAHAKTLKRFTAEPVEHKASIAFCADWLASKRVPELERLGTALYVTLEDPPAPDRAARICQLKPHVSAAEADQAVAELDAKLEEARAKGLLAESFHHPTDVALRA